MDLEYAEEQAQIAIQPPRTPRPPNCFMIWSKEKRKEIAQNNMFNSNIDTSIMLGKIWSSMSDKCKIQYKNKADVLKYEHKLKYPNYKYQPKKKELKSNQKDKENCKKTRKANNKNTKKEKLINKNKLNIIKEIILNSFEEPDYFDQVQLFYKDVVEIIDEDEDEDEDLDL